MSEPTKTISQVTRDALALSSGTIGSLIHKNDYETIDQARADFVKFCSRRDGQFENWVDAWHAYEDHNARIAEYRAKRAARAERLNAAADRIQSESDARLKRAHDMAFIIPFGQPILVGHYSEGRDRNYRGRIDSNFRKGFELQDVAADLRSRADSAESNGAIYSDNPAAVDELADKIEKLEAQQARYKSINAAYRKFKKDPASLDKSDLSDDDKTLIRIFKPEWSGDTPIPSYRLTNNNANIRTAKKRQEQVARKQSLEDRTVMIGDIKIEYAPSENRIRIFFPGRVDRETFASLRSHGYRVLRSAGEGAFSAFYNWNANRFVQDLQESKSQS